MAKEKDLLIEFLEEYSIDAVGKALSSFEILRPGISIADITGKKYYVKVRSESNASNFYNVSLNIFKDSVGGSCNCPAMARFGSCKHAALSAIYILVRLHAMSFESIENLLEGIGSDDDESDSMFSEAYNDDSKSIWSVIPATTVKTTKPVQIIPLPVATPAPPAEWSRFASKPHAVFHNVGLIFFGSAPAQIIKNTVITHVDEKEIHVTCECKPHKTNLYHPQIKYDGNETFSYKCDCQDTVKMCYHVKAAFVTLERERGNSFFQKLKNWDKEKNLLLAPYGLTIRDKEADNIEFPIDLWGNISMKTPTWLWKADFTDSLKSLKHILTPSRPGPSRPALAPGTIIDFEIGFLFNLSSQHFKTGFELETVKVFVKNNKQTLKKLSLHQDATLAFLKRLPDELYNLLLGINDEGIKKQMVDVGYRFLNNYSSPPWQMMDSSGIVALKQYYIARLQKLWPCLCAQEHVYILKEGGFSNANIAPAALHPTFLSFSFTIEEDSRYITIWLQKTLDEAIIPAGEGTLYYGFLFELNGRLHLPADVSDFEVLRQFEHGFIKIPASSKNMVIKSIIPLLQQKYKVEVPPSLTAQIIRPDAASQVILKEMDNKFLVVQPQFKYQEFTVNYEERPDNLFVSPPDGSGYYVIVRDEEKEKKFFESIKALHPKFEKQAQSDFFFLPFEDTMKKNWFINAIAGLVENNIPVLGIQDLKKHKYNTNKPKWEMKAGSGIDWFDLQIEVSFGDQAVSLRDVRKALLNKSNIVVLGDGTFGVLPEEWLKQYGLLLKMGDEQKDGTLRVSKLHYTLIDELHSQIDDEEIMREITEKKQRLLNIGTIKSVQPGNGINATLRPYQLSGFQWLHTLDEMGWGGCLADDMGLGKTLQAITFLHYLKEKYKGSTHLVICPTSLIYNWESELQKFAPSLKFHIYYGLERAFSEEHFNDYDVVITSYGIIRNDLEDLMKFHWHYIILDESQAIKNPDAQTNKALQLLKSKNRLILSGTPIQNNTYDLYAQFHFINPGLLGNRDFFKSEFANPIDKNNDEEKSAQLRRLIYPFMLRRTKQQVATDLPDKTETILWCEMGREQRKVYNDYKDYYRDTLMEKIKEVGMAKAGMYVLEGLLRLRQICDSPVLVKDKEVTTSKSVKIDELLREIEENAGSHKLLVFSQFTEMLHLIEDSLRSRQVSYAYLDGSTPAEKRKEAVARFQEDASVRVFLISLKAGGVGLNLTSADYVYLVDPWWNPAVEQQAIDRTHRIGQVNKIFAYKMICKDTVEEKIVLLQQRKKQLANDLVTEDTGFIKKLTKEDVAFLFS